MALISINQKWFNKVKIQNMRSIYSTVHILKKSLLFVLLLSLSFSLYGNDNYLKGYLISILEQNLNWQEGTYQLEVKDSVATIIVKDINCVEVIRAKQVLSTVSLLTDYNFINESDTSLINLPAYIQYPRGDYFKPVIADIKEPQFFISLMNMSAAQGDFVLGSVGLGQSFGLYRWPISETNNGIQLNFFMSLFSQFNMDTSSDDLLNSDYLVGFPLSFKHGNITGRLTFYHQSSHLGDEFLLSGDAPPRVNLSLEAFDLRIAYDIGNWRGVVGAIKIIRHDPSDLKERRALVALDYRNPGPIFKNSRFIAGVQTIWDEELEWNSGTSLKFGLEIGQSYPHRQGTRIMVEAYNGFIPFGQFYTDNTDYYGLGIYFDVN